MYSTNCITSGFCFSLKNVICEADLQVCNFGIFISPSVECLEACEGVLHYKNFSPSLKRAVLEKTKQNHEEADRQFDEMILRPSLHQKRVQQLIHKNCSPYNDALSTIQALFIVVSSLLYYHLIHHVSLSFHRSIKVCTISIVANPLEILFAFHLALMES